MKKIILPVIAIFISLFHGCNNVSQISSNEEIRAYDTDFNRGEGGLNGFAKPGLLADADPTDHVYMYKDLGCNVIQSFAVACNGYK